MKTQKSVCIFDVDGVLTNPYTKIPNQKILQFIADKLNKHEYVALVTGRAVAWVERRILPEITNKLTNKNNLDFLFLSGEMGAVTVTFLSGQKDEEVDTSVTLPKDVADKVKRLLVGKEHLLFVDPDKKTLLTIEMQGGTKEEVQKQTEELLVVKKWLDEEIVPIHPEHATHMSSIALDLMRGGITKKLGVKKFLAFLKAKDIRVGKVIAFGDSPSDVLLAEAAHEEEQKVLFLYAGPQCLKGGYPFPIKQPSGGVFFDAGVVQFISKHIIIILIFVLPMVPLLSFGTFFASGTVPQSVKLSYK